MTELRPYQLRAIAQTHDAWARGAVGVVLCMPTGAGKTVVLSELARQHVASGGSVTVLCHRDELIHQTRSKLASVGLPDAPVDSVQTALRRDPRPCSLLILDECHHFGSSLWGQLPQRYTRALRLGLTATPQRGDGRALQGFDVLLCPVTPSELLAQGHLVPCRVLSAPDDTRADPLHVWREHAQGRRTITFHGTVSEAQAMAHDTGGACLEGRLSARARRDIVERFRAGDLRTLTSVQCLTEGFDAPETDCVLIARGVSHAGTWLQMIGRGLRPAPGKRDCLVLDCRGSVHDHGLPYDPREWTLTGRGHALPALPALSQCRQCGAVYRSDPVCPECGYATPAPTVKPTRAVPLAEVHASDTAARRREYWHRMRAIAQQRGYKPGWAAWKYRSKYGTWPPRDAG